VGFECIVEDWCVVIDDLVVDVVSVMILNVMHCEVVIVVVEVGKYVWVEKFVGCGFVDMSVVVEVVWCVGVVSGVGFCYCFVLVV